MAGYSGTPLARKLGIKANMQVLMVNAPDSLMGDLEPLPEGVRFGTEASELVDMLLFFTKSRAVLEGNFGRFSAQIRRNGMVWVCWPKKAAKVPTDLNGNVVRELGLATGMVDVKVCAVDKVWSGLKFVIRVKDR